VKTEGRFELMRIEVLSRLVIKKQKTDQLLNHAFPWVQQAQCRKFILEVSWGRVVSKQKMNEILRSAKPYVKNPYYDVIQEGYVSP
jgi:hypothetical protein